MFQTTFVTMSMDCRITIAGFPEIPKLISELKKFLNEVEADLSPFLPNSEISRLNRGEIKIGDLKARTQHILTLCDETRRQTDGFFDIRRDANDTKIDPCGLVKGWAINQAAILMRKRGFQNFMVEIAGDIQTSGRPDNQNFWTVGIRNPFNHAEIIKTVRLSGQGIATSGIDRNGRHIYNPRAHDNKAGGDIVSLTIISPNVFDADRFATAAFAMGRAGIHWIENQPGLEGYAISLDHTATFTSGFKKFVCSTCTA